MFRFLAIRKDTYRFAKVFLALALLFLANMSNGQKPILRFLSDSVSFGEPIEVVLYCKHSPDVELLFPDSSYNYLPFEFVGKRYFPTITVGEESTDSVVYTLRTFEDTNVFTLSLPVTLFKLKDTLRVFSSTKEIWFRPFIKEPSDSLKLLSNTRLLPLEKDFNYLIYLIVVAVLLVTALLVYLLFGKNLLGQIQRYRMKIAHKNFIRVYDLLTNGQNLSVKGMEEALSLWKKYIQGLETRPYTTYTSSEIANHLRREHLKKNLQNIDAAIYGGRKLSTAAEDFSLLRRVAIEIYLERVRER